MKSEEIKQLFEQFEHVAAELKGIECWSARDLQSLLGYSKWENFEKVIQKAKDVCINAGERKSLIIFLTSGKRYQCPKALKKR